ncbi:MAG TPA: XRE family transcriptional regulator [Ktedonobacterales bacterium]|jgi:Zn-dependent peptidase ImmA (M78 family)/DNA-binding XRE family transcriptional regulator|nr:XRE family transcriptional regulator [Ktedonobacterales bacterium]
MSAMIAERIRQARLAAGLTQNEVAQRLATLGHPITTAGLSKYEHGKSMPRAQQLLMLAQALAVKPSYFLAEPQVRVDWLAFRKHAALGERKQQQAQAVALRVIEGQVWLENALYPSARPQAPLARPARSYTDVESAAAALRMAWGLGDAPIESVTQAAEDHGCIVVGWRGAAVGFDGLSGWTTIGDDHAPTALVNLNVPDDRRRFNLAHELGHLTLRFASGVDEKQQERSAHRFASAFLVPAEMARRELGERRRHLALEELGMLKAKYGLSMQAWARRARDLGIIEQSYYTNWCKDFSGQGWRKEEPYTFEGREEPQRLRQMTLRALAEGVITEERARELCPDAVTPRHTPQPEGRRYTARELMRMPREERNRILATAAAGAEQEYPTNPELTEFEAFGEGDFYDETPE